MTMRHWLGAMLLVPLVACGGGSPTSPSPQPVPVPAPQQAPPPIIQPDPALFDSTFNAQLVHDAYDHPDVRQPARLLKANPSIYLQRAGLSDATVAALEQAARAVVPALTGGTMVIADFVTGLELRGDSQGWIVVQPVNGPLPNPTACGQALSAAVAGHIWLNIDPNYRDANGNGCFRSLADTFGHELGHALGFYHVADAACIMSVGRSLSHGGTLCDKERYHAGLAYQSNGAYSVAAPRIVID